MRSQCNPHAEGCPNFKTKDSAFLVRCDCAPPPRLVPDRPIAITPSEAGEGGKTFGWWVETDSADGGRTGQFVRDWSFIETLRSHIPTTKVTPLYTATPPAAEVSLTDAQCDSIYDALDSWAKSLSWQYYALPGHPDDRSAATEVIRAALRPFADENGNG